LGKKDINRREWGYFGETGEEMFYRKCRNGKRKKLGELGLRGIPLQRNKKKRTNDEGEIVQKRPLFSDGKTVREALKKRGRCPGPPKRKPKGL